MGPGGAVWRNRRWKIQRNHPFKGIILHIFRKQGSSIGTYQSIGILLMFEFLTFSSFYIKRPHSLLSTKSFFSGFREKNGLFRFKGAACLNLATIGSLYESYWYRYARFSPLCIHELKEKKPQQNTPLDWYYFWSARIFAGQSPHQPAEFWIIN